MLEYLDLKNLKIQKLKNSQKVTVRNIDLTIDNKDLYVRYLNKYFNLVQESLKSLIKDLTVKDIYDFNINILYKETNEELTETDFEIMVNIILSAFFLSITIPNVGRPRERRLDVPQNLKEGVNCNMSSLKKAINYQTLADKFQLQIHSGNIHFILVNGSENNE